MKRRVLPRDRVLSITSMRRHHLVESGHAVTGLELPDVGADLFDDARDVVALVGRAVGENVRHLPVLGVGPAHDDLDEDLVIVWDGDGRVHNLDFGAWGLLVFS